MLQPAPPAKLTPLSIPYSIASCQLGITSDGRWYHATAAAAIIIIIIIIIIRNERHSHFIEKNLQMASPLAAARKTANKELRSKVTGTIDVVWLLRGSESKHESSKFTMRTIDVYITK